MSLEMRPMCERCGVALAPTDEAYICTFECTFCPSCTQAMEASLPQLRWRIGAASTGSGHARRA